MKQIDYVDWEKVEEQAMDAAVRSDTGIGIVRVPLPPMTTKAEWMTNVQKSFARWNSPTLHIAEDHDGELIAVLIPAELTTR